MNIDLHSGTITVWCRGKRVVTRVFVNQAQQKKETAMLRKAMADFEIEILTKYNKGQEPVVVNSLKR